MKLVSWARVALALLMFQGAGASAYTVSFQPGDQSVTQGGEATVAVWASDLRPAGLGSYDVEVLFDATILAFDRVIDGASLGLSMGVNVTDGGGWVWLGDFSLDDPALLLASQEDDVLLFSLVFDAQTAGIGSLGFGTLFLSDSTGNLVVANAGPAGSVEVLASSSVPTPPAWWLVLTGLAGLLVRRGSPGEPRSS